MKSHNKSKRRVRWLSAVFGCALVIWGVDLWTGQGVPQFAQAAPGKSLQAAAAACDWEAIDALVKRLMAGASQESGAPEADTRDLFMPQAPFEALILPVSDASEEQAPAAPVADPQVEFVSRHRLRGVVLGARPLALVDERVLTLRSRLDDFQLVAIARDHVVFVSLQDQEQLVLKLAGPENEGSPPPAP